MIWTFFVQAGAQPCDTLSRLFDAPVPPNEEWVVAAEEEKILRDAFSSYSSGVYTENFALKWGSDYGGTPFSDVILSAFETLWEVQILEWGHAFPYGSETHLFNIYIGNTGPEVPTIPDGVAGYYTRDSEGWPMIVLHPNTLGAQPSEVFALLAHEFYHAVQDAEQSYLTPISRWVWEPTANWAAAQFVPDSVSNVNGLDSYMTLSEKSLRFFAPIQEFAPEEYYTYGSAMFPIHIHERLGEPGVIQEVWKRASEESDAVEVMSEILEEYGYSFEEVWMDHNQGLISLNYEYGDIYREAVTSQWYTETWSQEGVGIHEADVEQSLEHLGFHVHRLTEPEKPILRVQVWGEPIGTESSLGVFYARVVHKTSNDTSTYLFDMERNFDELRLDVDEGDEVYLVVGVQAPFLRSAFDSGETFTYSFSMEGLDLPPEYVPVEEDTGIDLDVDIWELVCGCNHADPMSMSAGLWALALYWRRRLY